MTNEMKVIKYLIIFPSLGERELLVYIEISSNVHKDLTCHHEIICHQLWF